MVLQVRPHHEAILPLDLVESVRVATTLPRLIIAVLVKSCVSSE